MLIALIRKELRETWWIAAVALAAFAFVIADLMGIEFENLRIGSPQLVPFTSDGFDESFTLIAACLAAALGFQQTIWEAFRGTWMFLLHRPLHRRTLIGAKLATGLVLYLVCAALPVLIYAAWAATPGTHAGPFRWEWTLVTWKMWFCATSVYLAAFLVGIREARWHGSRLLPLMAAGIAVFLAYAVHWWPLLVLVSAGILDLLLFAGILFEARTRDYS
jgi:ABC-type transport system involved in multi-copper enzyme maturation permease subunit